MSKILLDIFIAQKKKQFLRIHFCKKTLDILRILKQQNLIYSFSVSNRYCYILLKLNIMKKINFYSTPSKKVYCNLKEIKSFSKINSILLINTTQGILTTQEVLRNKQGGEIICEIIF